MNIFHRHTFDPEKWELVSECSIIRTDRVTFRSYDVGITRVYKNTCKDCGDLVFRRVNEVE
jgi:hypothetical protein